MEEEGTVAKRSHCWNQQWARVEMFITRPLQLTRTESEGEVVGMDQLGVQVSNNAFCLQETFRSFPCIALRILTVQNFTCN